MKTYKREVAVACLFYLAALGISAAIYGSEPALKTYEVTIAPVIILVGGAFRFDAWSKQGRKEFKKEEKAGD